MMLDDYVKTCPNSGCHENLSAKEMNSGRCYECDSEFDPKQRAYALENRQLYTSLVQTQHGSRTIIELADGRITGKILEVYGDWAVTDFGVECLIMGYCISNDRLNETDWPKHVCEKTWVNPRDFNQAYSRAKALLQH